MNIWQSYKEERNSLVHFARLANTLLKDEESGPAYLANPVESGQLLTTSTCKVSRKIATNNNDR